MSSTIKNSLILLAISLLLINPVLADAVTPPFGVEFVGYVSHCEEVGIWWLNPTDPDFAKVDLYLDDSYLGETSSNLTHFNTSHVEVLGSHIFSTQTKDTSGNINLTWQNITFELEACPTCKEDWFCTDWCSIPPDLSIIFQKSSHNPSALTQKSLSADAEEENTWIIFVTITGIIAILGFVYFYQQR